MLNERKWLSRSNQNGTGGGNSVSRLRFRDPYTFRARTGTKPAVLPEAELGNLVSLPHALRQSVKVFQTEVGLRHVIRHTRADLPNDHLSFEGGACSLHPRTLWWYRSPPIHETAYVEPNVKRSPGGLPTAGQRHGRERRPAVRPWTTRHSTSNGKQPADPGSSYVTGSTGTGYSERPRFLMRGEPRFLNALR